MPAVILGFVVLGVAFVIGSELPDFIEYQKNKKEK